MIPGCGFSLGKPRRGASGGTIGGEETQGGTRIGKVKANVGGGVQGRSKGGVREGQGRRKGGVGRVLSGLGKAKGGEVR